MSRIGKQQIVIPDGVTVTVSDEFITVKGPKGELQQATNALVSVVVEGQEVKVTVANPEKKTDRAMWGLYASLVVNMITGVTEGFTKVLEVNGVGYKVALQGSGLKLDLGYSHSIEFPLPDGIQATVEKNVITISGISKQLVGQVAADIRKLRKPEPYKGKGIKYQDEIIRRKAGKAAKAAA